MFVRVTNPWCDFFDLDATTSAQTQATRPATTARRAFKTDLGNFSSLWPRHKCYIDHQSKISCLFLKKKKQKCGFLCSRKKYAIVLWERKFLFHFSICLVMVGLSSDQQYVKPNSHIWNANSFISGGRWALGVYFFWLFTCYVRGQYESEVPPV